MYRCSLSIFSTDRKDTDTYNRLRNNTKYRKECVLEHYHEFKNVCQIILVYGKDLEGLVWLGNRLHHWKNATIGYCFAMIASR